MTGFADANLVLAAINPQDGLHARAKRHLGSTRLTVPFSVGIELILIARKKGYAPDELLDVADLHFELAERDLLFTAADALVEGEVATTFDAIHLAAAFRAGTSLHTADAKLLRSHFPTVAF